MSSRRAQKVAEAIREVVSMAILAELKDPRIQDVTVTFVEVSGDLRHAKIHVSVMGDDTKQQLSLRGLQSAAGFLQSRCAARIDTRYTPRIQFILDQGVKKSIEVSRILDRVLPREEQAQVPPAESDDAPAEAVEPGGDDLASLQPNRAPPDAPPPIPDRQEPS
jgi:ribosome-binding factor A